MGNSFFLASTRDVPKIEKIDYWASVLGDVWGHIQVEPTNRDEFDGKIRSVKSCQLTFNEIQFRGHNIHRTASNIAKMKQDFYVLAFPRGNSWQMKIRGELFTLKRGNIYLLSNTVPYKSIDKEGYDTFNVMIPSQILMNMVPNLETRYTFPLGGANRKAQILRDFVYSLYGCLPLGGDDEARFMENNLLNLLAFMLEDKFERIDASDSSVKLAHRKRILDYIDKNLGDEFMSPESIAQQHGISVSYLHRVFKPHRGTVVEVIREKRLQAAKRLLLNPDAAGLSITEVAYQVGFKHPSDFSRAYKGKYGHSPREAKSSQAQD